MGFLNSDSITVDAILTKFGRRKLAEGGTLGIAKFALSDDGVNYELWNTAHPSGSNKYGAAITDTPQLEAFPDDSVVMKYKLLDLDRNVIFLPHITGIVSSKTLETQTDSFDINPVTNNGSDSGFIFLVNDASGFHFTGATMRNIGGSTVNYLARAEIPNATEFHGTSLKVTARPTSTEINTVIQIFGQQTGAVAFIDITAKTIHLTYKCQIGFII